MGTTSKRTSHVATLSTNYRKTAGQCVRLFYSMVYDSHLTSYIDVHGGGDYSLEAEHDGKI